MIDCNFYFAKVPGFERRVLSQNFLTQSCIEHPEDALGIEAHEALVGFRFEGHAGADDPGYDLVCAAVTSLAATMITAADELLGTEQNFELRSGFAELEPLYEDSSQKSIEDVNLLLETLYLGLRQINDSYGREYLRFKSVLTTLGGKKHAED